MSAVASEDVGVVARPRPGTGRRPPSRAAHWISDGATYAVAVALAILLAALLVTATGGSSLDVVDSMVNGSVGSTVSRVASLNHAAPLLLTGIGACIALRGGLLNIGLEGQLLMGAMSATMAGLWLPGPAVVVVPAMVVCGAAGGALWALPAALLKAWRGIDEVITTLLMNFLAVQVVSYAVNQSWFLQRDPLPGQTSVSPQSNPLPSSARLPVLVQSTGYRLTYAIVIAVVLAVVVWFCAARTPWGFRLRVLGLNPRAALASGTTPARSWMVALALSGAAAGLAGAVQLSGTTFQLQSGLANNYGWEGLLVALVAAGHAVFAIPTAILFGAIRAGGGVLATTGVDSSIVGVVQALLVFAVTIPSVYLPRRRAAAALRPLPHRRLSRASPHGVAP